MVKMIQSQGIYKSVKTKRRLLANFLVALPPCSRPGNRQLVTSLLWPLIFTMSRFARTTAVGQTTCAAYHSGLRWGSALPGSLSFRRPLALKAVAATRKPRTHRAIYAIVALDHRRGLRKLASALRVITLTCRTFHG